MTITKETDMSENTKVTIEYNSVRCARKFIIVRTSKSSGVEEHFHGFVNKSTYEVDKNGRKKFLIEETYGIEDWQDDFSKGAWSFDEYTECRAWFDSLNIDGAYTYKIDMVKFDWDLDNGLCNIVVLKTMFELN